MTVPDTACYSKRLASLVVIAGVLALGCLSEHVQAEHIYAQYEQDLLQSIAASAYVNLLLVSLYTTFYLATCIYRAVTLRRSSTSAAKQPDTVRSARIICLASDKDCEKLQFKELCRIQRVRASMRVDESDPHLIPVEYITPAWLWYYIYAVGTGVFVLGYSLHGGHQQASCVLACSLTLCSLYTCVAEAYQSGSTSDVVSRVCGLLFLTPAVVLLCIHASTNAQLEVDPDMPRRALQSAWLGLVLPLLTPLALHACRHRATSAAMTADMIVAFAMPFVAALSVSYLSVYTPTHAAWIDHHVADVTLWWHGNITVTTLAERHARQEWGYILLLWFVWPAVTWAMYVTVLGGLMSPYRIPGCTAALVLVLSCRRIIEGGSEPVIQAAIGLAVGAVLATAAITPLQGRLTHQPLEEHLDVLFEDADDATPIASEG